MSRFKTTHYDGRVIDRNDPDGLGRIKVEVPGIFDAPGYSSWISPWGMFDSTSGRGFYIVPKLLANITVMFIGGDALRPEFCRYMSGPWGDPLGVTDVPIEAVGVAGIPDPDISVMAFSGFAIVVDERDTFRKATLVDRTNGSFIRLDIEAKSIDFESALNFNRSVGQDENIDITGNKAQNINGNKSSDTIGSDEKTSATKKVTTTGDDERVIGGDWKITVTGKAQITATDNVEITTLADAVINAPDGQKVELNVGAQTVLKGETTTVLLDAASEVKIGRLAFDSVALKTALKLWLESHTHPFVGLAPGTPGVTSPPLPAVPVPDAAFSTKTKAE